MVSFLFCSVLSLSDPIPPSAGAVVSRWLNGLPQSPFQLGLSLIGSKLISNEPLSPAETDSLAERGSDGEDGRRRARRTRGRLKAKRRTDGRHTGLLSDVCQPDGGQQLYLLPFEPRVSRGHGGKLAVRGRTSIATFTRYNQTR